MAEIIQKDGTWTFDGDTVRIVPGRDKGVSLLRQTLGELAVPLGALAGIAFESGKKGGRLRLRLRDGADPLLQVTGGRLEGANDPYQLAVDSDRSGVAEYLVDEVRNALLLDQVPTGPVDRFLLPGPSIPVSAAAGDGSVTFDGEQIRIEWNWKTEESKRSAGPVTIPLKDVQKVKWQPSAGLENGFLRFVVPQAATTAPAKYDLHAVELWGFKKDPLMALVGAAVAARLDRGESVLTGPADSTPAPPAPADPADHDVLLRRLRELGELHQAGILDADEFKEAKQAILKRLQ
ncbi:DUF4429 domain-containing protein [Streptomyces sp. NBC_01465]|uniref:DUF4429 domain-containing protein n=1 Tax=Streptomyces sp. NBC_01465 TaxID=2903878 RepID=UPI002E34DC6D|nr:DUF4429 domain-containing protein [Streptomyces sp. NBC_01465]